MRRMLEAMINQTADLKYSPTQNRRNQLSAACLQLAAALCINNTLKPLLIPLKIRQRKRRMNRRP